MPDYPPAIKNTTDFDYEAAIQRIRERAATRQRADWPDESERPEIPEIQRNPRNQNDSEGLQKEIEDHGTFAQSLKKADVESPEAKDPPVLDLNLPLRTFVAKAALISVDRAREEYGEAWKSSTWEFVRFCRTHPTLCELTADEALRKIPWNATGFDEEEQLQVLVEWDRVRCLPGVSPLEFAARLAQRHPLYAPRKQFKKLNEFVSLAGWLQVSVGPSNSIFLPTRKVAEILDLKSKSTVATLCKLTVADKLMDLVEPATQHRATRYHFRIERYEILRHWKNNTD